MMPIVSSTATLDTHAQSSGARYCVERHTDSLGRVHQIVYLAAAGFDTNAALVGRAAALDAQLADEEAAAALGE